MPKKASSSNARNFISNNNSFGFGLNSSITTTEDTAKTSTSLINYELFDLSDSILNLCFKKLLKRDTITKLKALNELYETIKLRNIREEDSNNKEIIELFNLWVHTYIRLSNDNDRNIREYIYKIFILLFPLKKLIQLNIKLILPKWLLNFYDISKEVRNVSKDAFKLCFPIHKHSDVLVYCKNEINIEIDTNLSSTVATLSDLKIVSKEEAENKWERVISSSLAAQAANYPLCPLPNFKLITNFLKSKIPDVRRGAYKVALLYTTQKLEDKDVKDWFKIGLEEEDPLCVADSWDFLIACMNSSFLLSIFPIELLFDRLRSGSVPFNKFINIFKLLHSSELRLQFLYSSFTNKQITVQDGKKWNSSFWECVTFLLLECNESNTVDKVLSLIFKFAQRLIFLPTELYLNYSVLDAVADKSILTTDSRLLEKMESSIYSEFVNCLNTQLSFDPNYLIAKTGSEQKRMWSDIVSILKSDLDESIMSKILSKFSTFFEFFSHELIFEDIYKLLVELIMSNEFSLKTESVCLLCRSFSKSSKSYSPLATFSTTWKHFRSINTKGLLDIVFIFMKDNAESLNVLSFLALEFTNLPEFLRCCIFKFVASIFEFNYSSNFLGFSDLAYNEFMLLLTKDSVNTTVLSINCFLASAFETKSDKIYKSVTDIISKLKLTTICDNLTSRMILILHSLLRNEVYSKFFTTTDLMEISKLSFIINFNYVNALFTSIIEPDIHKLVLHSEEHHETINLCLNLKWFQNDDLESAHDAVELNNTWELMITNLIVDSEKEITSRLIFDKSLIELYSNHLIYLASLMYESLNSGKVLDFNMAIKWSVLSRNLIILSKVVSNNFSSILFKTIISRRIPFEKLNKNFQALSCYRFCLFMLFDSVISDFSIYEDQYLLFFDCMRLDYLLQTGPIDHTENDIDPITDIFKVGGFYGSSSLTLSNPLPNFSFHYLFKNSCTNIAQKLISEEFIDNLLESYSSYLIDHSLILALDSIISQPDLKNYDSILNKFVSNIFSSTPYLAANYSLLFNIFSKYSTNSSSIEFNIEALTISIENKISNFNVQKLNSQSYYLSLVDLGSLFLFISSGNVLMSFDREFLLEKLQFLSQPVEINESFESICSFYYMVQQNFISSIISFFQNDIYSLPVYTSQFLIDAATPLKTILNFKKMDFRTPSLPSKTNNNIPVTAWKAFSRIICYQLNLVSYTKSTNFSYSTAISNFLSLSAINSPNDAIDSILEIQFAFVNSLSSSVLKLFFEGEICLAVSRNDLLDKICILSILLPQSAIAIGSISDDSIQLVSNSLLQVMINLLESPYSPLVAAAYSVLSRMLTFHIQNTNFQEDIDEFDFYQPEEDKDDIGSDSESDDDSSFGVKITDITDKYLENERSKSRLPSKIFLILPEYFCNSLKPVSMQIHSLTPLIHANLLRRYLLCWSLFFDMFQVVNDSSQDKLKLCVVAYLRNSFEFLVSHFASEILEHILVTSRLPNISTLLESLSGTSSQIPEHKLSSISFAAIMKPIFKKINLEIRSHEALESLEHQSFGDEFQDGWIMVLSGALNPTYPVIKREKLHNTGTINSIRRVKNVLRQAFNENIGGEDTAYTYPVLKLFYGELSVWLYLRFLNLIPSLARTWFNHCHHHVRSRVSKLTSDYFSSTIISKEILSIRVSADSNEEFKLRGSILSSEVYATYMREEIVVSLKIILPPAYPLHNVIVSFTQKSGVEESLARRWLLTISGMCQASNSNLIQSLLLWQTSVDKKFSGIEECPICYSVVHASTHSLPKMPCRTCKHKFHAACLYKWFSSSAASTCPLCRAIF